MADQRQLKPRIEPDDAGHARLREPPQPFLQVLARRVEIAAGGAHAPARDQQRRVRAVERQRAGEFALGEQHLRLVAATLLAQRLGEGDERLIRKRCDGAARVQRGECVGLGSAQVARMQPHDRPQPRGSREPLRGAALDRPLDLLAEPAFQVLRQILSGQPTAAPTNHTAGAPVRSSVR